MRIERSWMTQLNVFMLSLWIALIFLGQAVSVRAAPTPHSTSLNASNEWRQPNANSAHSRSLSETLAPPLQIVWRVKLSLQPMVSPVAAGDTLYLDGDVLRANLLKANQSQRRVIVAIETRNGHRRWTQSWIPYGDNSSLIAARSGVFLGMRNQFKFLAVTNGANLLTQTLPVDASDDILGLVNDTLYLRGTDSQQTGLVSFQTFDMNTLQSGPPVKLSISYKDYYGNVGPWPVSLVYIGTLEIDPSPRRKITLFMQDGQDLLTTEGPPNYRPHVIAFSAREEGGLAVGGSSHAYVSLTVKDEPLAAINPSGKIAWLHHFFSYYVVVASTDHRVFVQAGKLLYALDAWTGQTLWTIPNPQPYGLSPFCYPIVMGTVLYVLSSSSPVPHGTSQTGGADSISAYSVVNGRRLWSRQIGHRLVSFIGHRGALYVVDSIPHPQSYDSDYFLLKMAGKSK